MKHNKQALAKSVLALLLCVAVLVGTTFAWFTDSVVSGINTIAAGNLDVELYHSNAAVTNQKVTANTQLFLDLQGNPILWEPGVVSYENLRVTNEGDLALIYQMAINTANENYILDNGAQYGLSQVLKVGVVEGGITATDRDGVVASVNSWTTLANFLCDGSLLADGEETWGVVIYWQPGDNDNNWNANNGKQLSSGDALSIDLGIKLTATQEMYENDSFGNDYDADAKEDLFPVFNDSTASVPVTPDANGYTTEDVTITAGDITALVPAGTKLGNGVNKLTLSVTQMPASEANVSLGDYDDSLSLDVHVEGVAADNTTPITVTLPTVAPEGLNMSNYQVYHVEGDTANEMTLVAFNADFTAHNQFKYDPATGDMVLYMQSFSEVLFVAERAKWEGGVDHSWYNASATKLYISNADQLWSFSQIVGGMAEGIAQDDFAGKTVILTANIDLNDLTDENNYVFYPIGYHNSTGFYKKESDIEVTSNVSSFEGIFDGDGHTIMNFYQNTWEMFGDYNDGYSGTPNHYKDAMGLFGYVYNGTVKNLTVKNFSSDGEFAPTGVIAAFAAGNAKFENIAIVNCNPRVYNTGNGGIIGIAGNYESPDATITLKNVTVDNTNKISALWGSWDVACGGLVGMFRGNTDGGQAKIHFDNCRVAAQIDVNNDVCANYQYYAYRYAGMMIGSVRHNTTDANGREIPVMDGISAENCTVNYGNWNNYYYCELVANTLASYTHDHQMSRLTQVQKIEGNTVYYMNGTTSAIPTSGSYNYVVVNGSHSTENATCYHYVNGVQWTHDQAGTETVDGETVLKEDKQHLYLPFVDQIVTGYGWGVDSRGIDELPGVMKVELTTYEESVEKWTGKTVGTLTSHTKIKLGDLFAEKGASVPVLNGSVTVAVTDMDNAATIYADKVTIDPYDWKNTTLVLEGYGTAQITIQDYYFCQPTTIVVTVKNPLSPIIDDDRVTNGHFETGTISGWQGYKATISESAAYSDLYGIQLKGDGSYGGMMHQTMTVEPGKTYALSMWIRVKQNGVNIQVKDSNADGELLASNWFTNTEWTNKVFTFTAVSDKVFLNFCGGGNGIAENVYIDDIILEKIMYVVNGHFEYGQASWTYKSGSHELVTDSHGGNYAMKLTDPGQYGEAAVSSVINVEPGKTYVVKWWSKRLSYNTYVNDKNQTKISTFNMYIVGKYNKVSGINWMADTTGQWVETKFVFEAVDSVIQLKFSAEATTPPGSIIIDDVRMYELKNPTHNGLITDGDFETGEGSEADYWNKNSRTSVIPAAAHSGDYGMKMVGNGTWDGMAWQEFNTEIGKTYTVTLYAKVVSNGVNVTIQDGLRNALKDPSDPKGEKIIGKWINAGQDGTNTDWQMITLTFKATETTHYINFNGGGNGIEEIVYVDDIFVTLAN